MYTQIPENHENSQRKIGIFLDFYTGYGPQIKNSERFLNFVRYFAIKIKFGYISRSAAAPLNSQHVLDQLWRVFLVTAQLVCGSHFFHCGFDFFLVVAVYGCDDFSAGNFVADFLM